MQDPQRSHWDEVTEQIAQQAKDAGLTAAESMRVMQKHLLRSNAEILKGILTVVEGQIARLEGMAPAVEKPPVVMGAASESGVSGMAATTIPIVTSDLEPSVGAENIVLGPDGTPISGGSAGLH